VSFELLFEGR